MSQTNVNSFTYICYKMHDSLNRKPIEKLTVKLNVTNKYQFIHTTRAFCYTMHDSLNQMPNTNMFLRFSFTFG